MSRASGILVLSGDLRVPIGILEGRRYSYIVESAWNCSIVMAHLLVEAYVTPWAGQGRVRARIWIRLQVVIPIQTHPVTERATTRLSRIPSAGSAELRVCNLQ